MTRKKGCMTPGEQTAGTVFFLLYLLALPLAADPLFRLVEKVLHTHIDGGLQNALCHYGFFAATLVIFHDFLGCTSRNLADNFKGACETAAMGLVALYGLNELAYRLTRLLLPNQTNLNDNIVSARIDDAPHVTLLIVLFLAPFVEETLFRGLVFGSLRGRSRAGAYLFSCLLFALFHVWPFAVARRDIAYLLPVVQYVVPGVVLAWAYEHSGTLWTSVAVHASANAISVLTAVFITW